MADLLSKQYTTVFSKPIDPSTLPRKKRRITGSDRSLHTISFTENDIIKAIDEISSTAAAGPDAFPAILLKKCKTTLAKPIAILWQKCLDTGHIPLPLKQSMIVPQHKGDSRALPANYRPIALTSHLIKIFEKILRNHVVTHLEKNNLFNTNQHGFRAGRSCLSQLLEHFDSILNILDSGSNADVIYLDYSKAFDKVDFSIVLDKLMDMGVNGKVYDWIESFLTDRVQFVTVNGFLSEHQPVISGVPQGSVLGPLLFLILLDDIDKDISVETLIKSFADDTRATRGVNSVKDTSLLQDDLNRIYAWSKSANMELNDDKFESLRYGKNKQLKDSTTYTTPAGKAINVKSTVKDLGVLMSDDCHFKEHIESIEKKAKSISSWILRTFSTRAQLPMLTLFKSLTLPILEYCSVLWCPLSVGEIQKLENIQWSFVRKIKGTRNMDYWQCLKELKLYSLERRRERYRIIYAWKILENLVPNINDGVKSKQHPRLGRKCIIPPQKKSTSLDKIQDSSFTMHALKLFNALPRNIRDMTNVPLDKFKKALDLHLRKIPDEPQLPHYTIRRRAPTNSLIDMKTITNSEGCVNLFSVRDITASRDCHNTVA